MDMGIPDVCLTPAGPIPVPTPYPNIAQSMLTAPAAYTVLTSVMPTLNQMSFGLLSNGDEAGALMGVVSHLIAGQTVYLLGCLTIMADGLPMQRLTSMTGQNSLAVLPNAPGMCIAPSQVTMLTLG